MKSEQIISVIYLFNLILHYYFASIFIFHNIFLNGESGESKREDGNILYACFNSTSGTIECEQYTCNYNTCCPKVTH